MANVPPRPAQAQLTRSDPAPAAEPTHPPIRALTRRQRLVFALILVVAATVRFVHIDAPSLWMDELWSIEMSMGRGSMHDHLPLNQIQTRQTNPASLSDAASWTAIWTHMTGVPYPPLYHLVLRWWMDLAGTGAAATRSVSAVFSLAGLALMFDLVRRTSGNVAALWTAALMALAGTQIDFAQEARSYAMLMCLGIAAADVLVRIQYRGVTIPRVVALAFLASAMVLTHYLAVGLLFALAVYALLRLRGSALKSVLIGFAAGAVLTAIVWGPFYVRQIQSLPQTDPPHLHDAQADHVQATLQRIVQLPCQYLLGELETRKVPGALVGLVAVVALLLPAIRCFSKPDMLLWVLWTWGTIGLVGVYDLSHGWLMLGYPRFTLLASPGVYAAIACLGWPRRPAIAAGAIPAILLLAMACFAAPRLESGKPAWQDLRDYALRLDQAAEPHELLVFYGNDPWRWPGFSYAALKYYAPDSQRPWLIMDRPADAGLLTELGRYHSLWLIGEDPPRDAPSLLPGWKLGDSLMTGGGVFWRLTRGSAR